MASLPLCQTSKATKAFCASSDVRFGSKADICSAKAHVRFTPQKRTLFGGSRMSAMCQKRTFAK
jgi:hypothetical protein